MTLDALLGIARDLFIGGTAAAVYLRSIWPELRIRGASRVAFAVAGGLSASIPVALVMARVTPIPPFLITGLFTLLLAFSFWPAPVIRVTGRLRTPPSYVEFPPSSPTLRAWLAIVASTAIVAAAPIPRACGDVDRFLVASPLPGDVHPLPLSVALMSLPEPGALFLGEAPLDLEAAAISRHDPKTRQQLMDAGFVGGYDRVWDAADGRTIAADVFEFRDAAGAMSYHRTVNRYACRFSNLAFQGPDGAIGLQVRRSTGDPIVEQVSWVSGARRFVVSVRHLVASDDHGRVLDLARRQMAQSAP